MQTQRDALVRALGENGWRPAPAATSASDWQADEMLALESVWPLAGLRAFMTFLVDPQHDGPRGKGDSVWAVSVTADRPGDRVAAQAGVLLSLGHGWRDRLPQFVTAVNALRVAGAKS